MNKIIQDFNESAIYITVRVVNRFRKQSLNDRFVFGKNDRSHCGYGQFLVTRCCEIEDDI